MCQVFDDQSICLLTYRLFFDALFVLSLETLNAAGRIDQSLLAGVKRVALRADFEVKFLFGRACFERLAAGAPHDSVNVIWMYVCFHQASSNLLLYIFPV